MATRKVRVKKSYLRDNVVSFGAGDAPEEDDDNLPEFEIEKPLRCMWCDHIRDDQSDDACKTRCEQCNGLGVTRMHPREKKRLYVDEVPD